MYLVLLPIQNPLHGDLLSAAATQLLISGLNFFSFLHLFKHTLCNNFKQAVGPGVLQTFSTCPVKP